MDDGLTQTAPVVIADDDRRPTRIPSLIEDKPCD